MSIAENLKRIEQEIPNNVKIIAVSKTHPKEMIQEVYDFGHRVFGENKAQEMTDKYEALPKDIEWHMIGHLQTNKVKYIAPFVSMIHSVDSLKLLKEIEKEAIKNNRVIDCLLQIDIANEDTKFGMLEKEAIELLSSEDFAQLKNIRTCGVMGIGSITVDINKTRQEFKNLKVTFLTLKEKFFKNEDYFTEISMGMSSDYDIAIEEGSTIVRIGSLIFGQRDYFKVV
ncbi:MAG: YggS family pyridoxal phosphate-dependent enzyme [Bacteroidales bacterium]|nr:YggS family pyridoxal phosphate-dependent enzyme [Bacteroidales bacterium]MDD4067277.1 YggS family pyridoxal phosphate-dependent enzyme [Bacteroidales bacterium]MDD4738571.1 YggS family pyridoxal phosphate-dependent enzyme [Bacteroidales bacterium]